MNALEAGTKLQTRVGIATGLVVVGNLIGAGEAQERGIVGETPNVAARLQGIAEPNNVVIAESTRKLLGNLFELEDLGAKDLKGVIGPVRAWAALRPASVESRFEALHATGLTELVGRKKKNSNCCLGAGREARPAKARWCSSPARPVSANRVCHGRAAGTPCCRATHALALFLLPAAHRQRALSDHRPDGTCCGISPRRHPASEARQARCTAGADLDPD